MFRSIFHLFLLILIGYAVYHYVGDLDFGKMKARITGDNKGMGEFYAKKPASSSDGRSFLDKLKEKLSSGSSESESRKPEPPPSKPTWSEGVADPKKMNIVRDDQRDTSCFYPDIPSVCSHEKKTTPK